MIAVCKELAKFLATAPSLDILNIDEQVYEGFQILLEVTSD